MYASFLMVLEFTKCIKLLYLPHILDVYKTVIILDIAWYLNYKDAVW